MKIVYSKTTYRNVGYRALIAILMGVVLVVWPDVALKSLVMFIGFLFLFSGIMASIISYRRQQAEERQGSMFSMNGVGEHHFRGFIDFRAPVFHDDTDVPSGRDSGVGGYRPVGWFIDGAADGERVSGKLYFSRADIVGGVGGHLPSVG